MALIVETGSGSATAESVNTIAEINTYAVARGLTFAITGGTNEADAEAAARRAQVWLNGQYRAHLTGRKTNGRDQAQEYPRINSHDNQCPPDYLESDEIPIEWKQAHCEAAIREKADPGALSPDVTPGAIVKRERVEGVVDVEYASQSASVGSQRPISTVIDDILGSLLGPRSSGLFGKAVRA